MTKQIRKFIQLIIIIQITICFLITANQVLFNSSLKLWLSKDYFMFQKIVFMLQGDYQLVQNYSNIQKDAGILLVTEKTYWFINYYMLPRRLYIYPGVTKEKDLKKLPPEYYTNNNIQYIMLYDFPNVRLIEADRREQ